MTEEKKNVTLELFRLAKYYQRLVDAHRQAIVKEFPQARHEFIEEIVDEGILNFMDSDWLVEEIGEELEKTEA